jgi:2-polyprenyl-6-methoxyphenol hydroxylase-like FAD-dependent oxidoreductase
MLNNLNPFVLIAGGGPTGITAALELRRFGIPVRIVDEKEGPDSTSRAVGIQARTLEEFQLRGLADDLVRIGHHATGGDIYGEGELLVHVDFTRIPSSYNYLLFLSQNDTDRILREALASEGAAIEWGVKMIAFGQDASGITATLEHSDGSIEGIRPGYVIDAEGAHSIIRSTLGLEFKGKTLDETFVLGDVHITGDLPNSNFHIFSSPQGFLGLFPMGGSHYRLVAGNPAPGNAINAEQSAAPTLEELQAIYDSRSHIPARLHQLTWSSFFHINSRMVKNMRVGRIFLAGDAAHIHSPAGAQGMNTGIQDAMNLGWKLAFVMRGIAPEQLLDTYEEDRLPVMRSILMGTEGMTNITGGQSILRTFFIHLAPLFANAEFLQKSATSHISQVALNYRTSPLSEDNFGDGSLVAGDRIPDLEIRAAPSPAQGASVESRKMFSLLNPSRFALLLANFVDSAEVRAKISQSSSPWPQLPWPTIPWLQMIDIFEISAPAGEAGKPFVECFGVKPSITLVRPDAYIGFRGGQSSAEAFTKYCNRWFSPAAQKRAA